MKIDVVISAKYIEEEKLRGKIAVIIDTLRATSTITTALNNGAKEVIPVLTIEEALAIKENIGAGLLGGERKGLKIDGFDLSNSPQDYKKETVNGEIIIFTTTNGTRAIRGAKQADEILMGSVLNGKSVSEDLIKLNKDVVIINAGTYDQFSIDDFLTAGYIIDLISEKKDLELTDIAKTAQFMYKESSDFSFAENAAHYKRMIEIEQFEDLKYCFKKDIISVVPKYKDGIIKA
ncbi:MAG: 2-phosphosulfolactate phosphatase [Bacillota bacterium]|nr:2-phosphosulfolactate phosphatase [Bacillota bacterium]